MSGNALTNGVQGSNVYIGKSDQLIGSNEKLIAMNSNLIDTVALSDENLFSMYTNGLVKPLLINSIAIGSFGCSDTDSVILTNYSYSTTALTCSPLQRIPVTSLALRICGF